MNESNSSTRLPCIFGVPYPMTSNDSHRSWARSSAAAI